jgi:hypothetical protein
MKDKKPSCNCVHQIVWYFEKPTVIVCEECEITLDYSKKTCPNCGGEVTYFTKED